ncbi:MAG: hypothetical protein R3194_10935, partial [Limnobacter sp.]|nr:hypothetical protein [Limnobacter sp.]
MFSFHKATRSDQVWLFFRVVFAALLLNGLLGFVAVWPTVLVKPAAQLAPEFAGLLLVFLVMGWRRVALSSRLFTVLTVLFYMMVAGHYADVVVPHIFGRPVNLYWDVPQLPRFLWVTIQGVPWWATMLATVGLAVAAWALYTILNWALRTLYAGVRPLSASPISWFVVVVALVWVAPHYSSLPVQPAYLSKPVLPVYWKEAKLLWNAIDTERAEKAIPPSTVIENALAQPPGEVLSGLNKRDLMVMFLESYGSVLYDQEDTKKAISKTRATWENALEKSGRKVVSGFFTSPTFGGASDLAHMSLLSGIELPLSDTQRHDLLLTTGRPTLIDVFQHAGYDVFGLYHSVFWDWAERAYYGYDTYISGPDLNYTGPAFGYWKIPDQYAIAKYEQMY